MKNKIIHTNWVDVIVAKGQLWQSKILGGYERDVIDSFGTPIEFAKSHNLLRELTSDFTGEYVFVIERHQNIDPEKSIPAINDYGGNVDNTCYFTKAFRLISFSKEEDAILFKLKLEKINKC